MLKRENNNGKRVVEVSLPLKVDKGQALRRFVQRFDLQGVEGMVNLLREIADLL